MTHDHGHHEFKDAVRIYRRTMAVFVKVFELANKALWKFVKHTVGGEVEINRTKVYFAPAWHLSKIAIPCGFIVNVNDFTFYHTGVNFSVIWNI